MLVGWGVGAMWWGIVGGVSNMNKEIILVPLLQLSWGGGVSGVGSEVIG